MKKAGLLMMLLLYVGCWAVPRNFYLVTHLLLCHFTHSATPQMKQFLITSATELLLEAAVRLLVPDGGADDDVRT